MRRLGLLLTIALTFLSCPSNVCANGFEAGARQLFMIWVVFPVVMCCAGLALALCFSKSNWSLIFRPVLTGLLPGAITGLLQPQLFRSTFLPSAMVFFFRAVRRPSFSSFKPGDSVYALLGSPRGGAYAELAVSPCSAAALKARCQTHVEAASMPVAGLTALQSLRDLGRLKPNESVLVNGASGGVGTFAVQIAKALGARVTGVCDPTNVDLVRGLGVDEVLNYTQTDFTSLRQTHDVILDAVAKSSFSKCRRVLAPTGTYITTLPNPDVLLRGMVLQPLLGLMGRR